MSDKSLKIHARINFLKEVLKDDENFKEKEFIMLEEAITNHYKDRNKAKSQLGSSIKNKNLLGKIDLVNSLAEWTEENIPLAEKIVNYKGKEESKMKNLKELALNFNASSLSATLINRISMIPDNFQAEKSANERKKSYSKYLIDNLYHLEPSATLQRMAKKELPIKKTNTRKGIEKFFSNQPNFNIRTTSIYNAFDDSNAFKGIPVNDVDEVKRQLKILQRVQAISPIVEAIPVLMKANLHSAQSVADISQKNFIKSFGETLGEHAAKQIHQHAVNIKIRNEYALATLKETVQGTGVKMIDESIGLAPNRTITDREQLLKGNISAPLTWDYLFGGVDICECGQCNSVYSLAAYFVELLQFLRNDNLDKPNMQNALEGLLQRRPDLGNLDLTCENTNTVLPYIDLVNEVMESYVVHLKEQEIIACNVVDETSEELLAQPQHTNYKAYNHLMNEVYPISFPYHQPIDSIRLFLDHLKTSRYEIMDTFRPNLNWRQVYEDQVMKNAVVKSLKIKPEGLSSLNKRDKKTIININELTAQKRALNAEYLGLTEKDYGIITKEGFLPKPFYKTTLKSPVTEKRYQAIIGNPYVNNIHAYFGYAREEDMLSQDVGLSLVKEQFLPRTGILYTDLIELLKTKYINPDRLSSPQKIVLSTLNKSFLPLEGRLLIPPRQVPGSNTWVTSIYEYLLKNGDILNSARALVARVNFYARIESLSGNESEVNGAIKNDLNETIGYIRSGYLLDKNKENISWKPALDTCDLDKVKLHFLDGTDLTKTEYDRINRFLRLWRKLGWTMEEVDQTIQCFTSDNNKDITADFLSQLAAFKKIQAKLKLPILPLLNLWSNQGEERNKLLARILNINSDTLEFLIKLLGNPYHNPKSMVLFLDKWEQLKKSDFKLSELSYLIPVKEAYKSSLQPSKLVLLDLYRTLKDGLDAIRSAHPDVVNVAEATIELVKKKTALLYEQNIVAKIADLLEGTTKYKTKAPANLELDKKVLNCRKIKYDKLSGGLLIKGLPSEKEITGYKDLSADTKWKSAIDSIVHQAEAFLEDTMYAVFPDMKEAKKELLSNKDDVDPDEQAKVKRAYFLQHFLPFLRKELNKQFLLNTLSSVIQLPLDVTELLVKDVLEMSASNMPLIQCFSDISEDSISLSREWHGYLIPDKTEEYTFVSAYNKIVKINDIEISLIAGNNRNDRWLSEAVKLKTGEVYSFDVEVAGKKTNELLWKNTTTPTAIIHSSVLYPSSAILKLEEAFIKLQKAAIVIRKFDLNATEIKYFSEKPQDFSGLDFNAFSVDQILRLTNYTALHNSLPKTDTTLIELFKWARNSKKNARLTPLEPAERLKIIAAKIAAVTLWKEEKIKQLIADKRYNLVEESKFCNEIHLIKLQTAIHLASRIGVEDIGTLFKWADRSSNFIKQRTVSEEIQETIRSKYSEEDYFQIIKKPNDTLRENQKQALISYLLLQEELKNWGVRDADSLFEYFLIDVQMKPCMETSRIKQATSSVQLFIQRCILGLEEEKSGISNNVLNKERWDIWMHRYRVWEANRKVFLYPENWIEPNLRDEKSPFFKELESELLQKDVNKETVRETLRNYLYKVDEVANMKVVGLYVERIGGRIKGQFINKKIHVFARTRNVPYFFYYRYYDINEDNWYPWEKMQVDIPSYDVEDKSKRIDNGTYLIPIVWNKRLLVFFPQFMKKTMTNPEMPHGSFQALAEDDSSLENSKPLEYWEIKMAWSEYRNGKWTQKRMSKNALYNGPDEVPVFVMHNDHFQDGFNLLIAIEKKLRKIIRDSKFIWISANEIKQGKITLNDVVLNSLIDAGESQLDLCTIALDDLYELSNTGYYNESFGLEKLISSSKELIALCTSCLNLSKQMNVSNAGSLKADGKKVENKSKAILEEIRVTKKLFATRSSMTLATKKVLPDISKYKFSPNSWSDNKIVIKSFYVSEAIGFFEFDNSAVKEVADLVMPNDFISVDSFHHNNGEIHSLQANNYGLYYYFQDNDLTEFHDGEENIDFYYPKAKELLGKVNSEELKDFFSSNLSMEIGSHALEEPYDIYNWELFFHQPMMLADHLSKNQQFEEAMKWYHFIFDPYADFDSNIHNLPKNRFWQFYPFKETEAENFLEGFFHALKSGQADAQITEWRDKPFMPHVIARSRPTAYMKWVVMRYIDNLIAWGDHLFRQERIESINQATQLYILASHILGPRPQFIPKRGQKKAETYNTLANKLDAFSNAMVEMELAFPYSNLASTNGNNKVTESPNVYGSVSSLYFCTPNNPKLLSYWDTVEKRLSQIRNCQDIEGIKRKWALFEPSIDPALLVQAAAQGLSLSSVLNDLNAPMPNYRFNYLVNKAIELCNEVKAFGSSLLSVLEKKDAEHLSLMRTRHESSMQSLIMEVRKQQLEEANQSLAALQENRKSPVQRMQYYLRLIGEELSKVPSIDGDFNELANAIGKPVKESGLKLSAFEKEEMEKASEAKDKQKDVSWTEMAASIAHVIPNISTDAKPLGIGTGFSWGGSNVGSAIQAVAKYLQVKVNELNFESTRASKKGGYQRQLQDRIQQANTIGLEIKQIDKQITTQQIRINITKQELANHQQSIDNSQEVEEFLKTKYTNEELYSWMEGEIRTLYYQAYTLAYDIAKKAEKVYRFERGLTSSNFIQFGYWNSAREGFLSGERLYMGLKQLEAAYHEKRGHDYEITKHISLMQVSPMALLKLRDTGKCEFTLPEVLFDMDFPGHYKRRIKSVSISIPCVVGPYTTINCTARLLENKMRIDSIVGSGYSEDTSETDPRFLTMNIPIKAIAVSSGQNDSGVFELNFRDERFMPFEGAGVISKWRLELSDPSEFRPFDYDTISDVILTMHYTSVDGGDTLKTPAQGALTNFMKSVEALSQEEGLFAAFDLKNDFPNEEWKKVLELDEDGKPKVGDDGKPTVIEKTFTLSRLNERLPYFTKASGKTAQATDISLLTTSEIVIINEKPDGFKLTIGEGDDATSNEFGMGADTGNFHELVIRDVAIPISDWRLARPGTQVSLEKAWLVIRYVLVDQS